MQNSNRVNIAIVNVIDYLKNEKRGMPFAEIAGIVGADLNESDLMDLIKQLLQRKDGDGREMVLYDKEKNVFRYNYKYNFYDEKSLLFYLEEHKLLVIDEDAIEAYPKIMNDVRTLKNDEKILHVSLRDCDVIYLDNFEHGDLERRLSQRMRDLWDEIKKLDYGSIKRKLLDHGVSPAILDTNKNYRESSKERTKKRKRKKKSKYEHVTGIGILKALDLGEGEDEVGVPETIDDDDDVTILHNKGDNPEEYRVLQHVLLLVGHWFYNDGEILVLREFLKKNRYEDPELSASLHIPEAKLSSFLSQLSKHMLIDEMNVTVKGKKKQTYNVWRINLDKFVDMINYRVIRMDELLTEKMKEKESETWSCLTCSEKFSSLSHRIEIDRTMNTFKCRECESILLHQDNSKEIIDLQDFQRIVRGLMDPLKGFLSKLSEHKVNWKKPSTSSNSRRRGSITSVKNVRGPKLQVQSKRVNGPVDIIPERDYFVALSDTFNTKPLFFGKDDCIVFLPIIKHQDVMVKETACALAKTLLDEIADFQLIINATVYKYQLTASSLYLGFKRGYSSREVIRLFILLSRNPVPPKVIKLVEKYSKPGSFYQATMCLKYLKYCIQSENESLIQEFIGDNEVARLVPSEKRYKYKEKKDCDGNLTYYFEILHGEHENMKKVIKKNHNIHVIDEYEYQGSDVKTISLNPKARSLALRPYQKVSSLFWNNFSCHSGMLVYPCGSGKTIIGINAIATIKKNSIIFCQSVLAVDQWKDTLKKWTPLSDSNICRFTAKYHTEWNPAAQVLITTYGMFSTTGKRRKKTAVNMMNKCKQREWGLMVLDEVHLAPAELFKTVTNDFKANCKLGLTATLVREDDMIKDLPHLVGPKLYELDIYTLRMYKHIAPVVCQEIQCPLTKIYQKAYEDSRFEGAKSKWILIFSTNPNKFRIVKTLIEMHYRNKNKILVFCDNLYGLNFYASWLRKPHISGETDNDTRAQILSDFRKKKGGACILLSKVGDQSIDLPEADVVIQVALTDGSRMQEGQRIGRVQRVHPNKTVAYFYSLVSQNTNEMTYGKKRRLFLQDQGYVVDVKSGDDWMDFVHGVPEIELDKQKKLLKGIEDHLEKSRNGGYSNKGKPKAEPVKKGKDLQKIMNQTKR